MVAAVGMGQQWILVEMVQAFYEVCRVCGVVAALRGGGKPLPEEVAAGTRWRVRGTAEPTEVFRGLGPGGRDFLGQTTESGVPIGRVTRRKRPRASAEPCRRL